MYLTSLFLGQGHLICEMTLFYYLYLSMMVETLNTCQGLLLFKSRDRFISDKSCDLYSRKPGQTPQGTSFFLYTIL